MQGYFSTPLRVATFSVHGGFSVAALAAGLMLVVLWRPHSTLFLPKTKRLAQISPALWIMAYAAGVLAFVVYQTTLLG